MLPIGRRYFVNFLYNRIFSMSRYNRYAMSQPLVITVNPINELGY